MAQFDRGATAAPLIAVCGRSISLSREAFPKSVGDHRGSHWQSLEKVWRRGLVGSLTGSQGQLDRQALLIDHDMDLAARSSTRTAAVAFALIYGAGYGLLTVARGTLPLKLFATGAYGATVGRLLAPGFALSALSPLGYAFAIDWFGARAALLIALALTLLVVAAAVLLNARKPPVAQSFDRG